jgi:hypothetical protein
MTRVEQEYIFGVLPPERLWTGEASLIQIEWWPNRGQQLVISFLSGSSDKFTVDNPEPGMRFDVRDANGNPRRIAIEVPYATLITAYSVGLLVLDAPEPIAFSSQEKQEAQWANIGRAVRIPTGAGGGVLADFVAWRSGALRLRYLASVSPVTLTANLYARDQAGVGALYIISSEVLSMPAAGLDKVEQHLMRGAATSQVCHVEAGGHYRITLAQGTLGNVDFDADLCILPVISGR